VLDKGTLPPEVGLGDGFGLGLKDDNKFCADDLRRIVGRCISGGVVASGMDNTDPLRLAMIRSSVTLLIAGYNLQIATWIRWI
jgi:hypothetical protein